MMSINIFGNGGINLYDIEQDLNLNNNAIHGVKSPENDSDAANKRYVDSKMVSNGGWTLEGNMLHSEAKIGTLSDHSITFVRNNVPQMRFLNNQITVFNDFYLEKDGGYIGMQTLNADKEFGIYFGNNRNSISWRNRPTQPIRFTASTGFLFTVERTLLMTMSARNGIQPHKNIDMGINNRIINLPTPVNGSDSANKDYCDSKVSKNGDTMLGSLYFDGLTRNLDIGCNNLGTGKYFRLYLGSEANKVNSYNNVIDLFAGRILTVNVGSEMNVIAVDAGGIVFTKPLLMNDNIISGLGNPQEPRDAINKQYFDTKFEELNARLRRLESNFK